MIKGFKSKIKDSLSSPGKADANGSDASPARTE